MGAKVELLFISHIGAYRKAGEVVVGGWKNGSVDMSANIDSSPECQTEPFG
jgi:hypothetical protein